MPKRNATALIRCVALALASSAVLTAAAGDPWLRADLPADPADNVTSPARVELGRTLFFDPRLSGTNTMSCATCHDPDKGWSDGRPVAVGDAGQPLARGTLSIMNSGFATILMWDGRAATLEAQALAPITATDEMNQPMPLLLQELRAVKGYIPLFEQAYPGEGITEATVAKALAAFQRSIVSGQSPFDRWRRGQPDAMSESAQRGFFLFRNKANCAVCHMDFNFTDDDFHNIGVRDVGAPDPGRSAVTRNPLHRSAFKTPGLRDVALTAPYMHNGLYATLDEVVEHYDRGGDSADNLSGHIKPLRLSTQDKADLVAFMHALTAPVAPIDRPRLPQ